MVEKRNFFYVQATQQINQHMNQSEQQSQSAAQQRLGMFDAFGKKVVSTMTQNLRKGVLSTSNLVNMFAANTEKAMRKAAHGGAGAFTLMFEKIATSASKMRMPQLGVGGMGGGGHGGGGFGGGGGGGFFGPAGGKAMSAMFGALTKILPLVTKIGSVAAFLAEVFHKLVGTAEDLKPTLMAFGGSSERLNGWRDNLTDISNATLLSMDDTMKLGAAFHDLGLNIDGTQTGTQDMIVTAGALMHVFDMSEESIATYGRALIAAGKDNHALYDEMDGLFRKMQGMNLTVQDLNNSVTEGTYQWSVYGGTLGKTIGDFSSGVLETKGLFKSLNIDARESAKVMEETFGNVDVQKRQAALISGTLGIRGSKARNMMVEDPAQGQKLLIQSAMTQMVRRLGPNAQYLGMNQSQRQGAFSDDQRSGLLDTMSGGKKTLNARGVNDQVLNQALTDYQAYIQKTGEKVTEDSISKWMDSRQAAMTPKSEIKTLAQGMEGLATTLPEAMNKVGLAITNAIQDFAHSFDRDIPKIIGALNSILGIGQQIYNAARGVLNFFHIATADAVGGAINSTGAPGAIGGTMDVFEQALSGMGSPNLAKNAQSGAGIFPPSGFNMDLTKFPGVADLNKYRAAQGMGKARALHPNIMKNAAIVMAEAKKSGTDAATAIATMIQESGGNESVLGDNGYFAPNPAKHAKKWFYSDPLKKDPRSYATSGGLFQLHDAGKGHGLSNAQKQNPYLNAARAVPDIGAAARAHPNWSKGQQAAWSQNPANKTAYAQGVNNLLPLAEQIKAILEAQMAQQATAGTHLADMSGAIKESTEVQKKQAEINKRKAQSNSSTQQAAHSLVNAAAV